MKKSIIATAFAAVFICAVFLAACASSNNAVSTSPSGAGAPSGTSVPASTEAATSGTNAPHESSSPTPSLKEYEFKDTTFSSGVISVKYPQVVNLSDASLQDKLNKFIANTALQNIDALQKDQDLTDYEITSEVTYNTPGIISMYFSGSSNYVSAAHPSQFLYSVTIDTEKLETVPLSSLVKIDEGFLKLLAGGNLSAMGYDMTAEYEASIRDYLKQMESDPELWLKELKNADTPGYETVSYLTPDALVVSVSVPHVMGDHIEIALKYKDLDGVKTNNPLWKAIDD